MSLPGHRDNPLDVTRPGDLDRAVGRVWDPTPGQAEAGNYGKAHALVGGLPVTIETPRDRVRSGISPDGTPWSVRMPAHYGYVKRSEGADGDQVDVYIGTEAHAAPRMPVWVIDQVDADTRDFDEHKVFLGFPHREAVRDTYHAAFSDGRGRERTGAAVRMTFSEFLYWLAHGNTRAPLAYRPVGKALRTVIFSPSVCTCSGTDTHQRSDLGGSMPAKPDAAQSGISYVTKAIGAMWGRMTPAERGDLLKDAAVTATVELGKAENHLLHEGDDRGHVRMVEDQWDGPPDDHLETVQASGPDSSVPAGKVGVGPSEDASGAGADRMENRYSRHTPQHGVQRATEELGAKLRSHGAALKSVIGFAKAMSDRVGMIEMTMATAGGTPLVDKAELDAAVAKAVSVAVATTLAKAIPDIIRTVIKAKGDSAAEKEDDKETESGKDDEEEDADEEADQEESGSGTEIEITNELEEEGEDDDDDEAKKAAHKAAAQERLIAKGLIRLARKAAAESADAMEDGMPHAGKRHHKKAGHRMHKARLHAAIAKSLRDGKVGPSMKAIEASFGAVAKALKDTKAKNQDKWPTGKSVTTTVATEQASASATAVAAASPDVMKAVTAMAEAVTKANAGYALLTADVQKLMQIVGGQSRDPGAAGGPPVESLFKADILSFDGKAQRINALAQERTITATERDKAMDALATMRVPGMPAVMLEATINGCPEPVRAILKAA